MAARAEHRLSNNTFRAVWPDGSLHWLEEKGRPQYAADGTLMRMTGTTMDITDRKQAETALRTSEERLSLALQAASMGTWDYDVYEGALAFSAQTEVLHGLDPGTFEGTFAAFAKAVHADDWPAVEIEIRACQVERRDTIFMYRTNWPDGSVHWVENKGRTMYAADGRLVRVMGISTDITERKQAEAALHASEERNRLALAAAGMGTWDYDLATEVHSWSAQTEALFGLAPGTFGGTLENFVRAVHPDDWVALDRQWHIAISAHRDFRVTYRTIWPDGSLRWIEDNGRSTRSVARSGHTPRHHLGPG
jgi:PAS domain S-box-containing protein